MPVINGQKMACAPCIRGHRSTKCPHGTERVLIPVRKPGRPLSSCPHPPGSNCGCDRSITAAIPRNQKCPCPPETHTQNMTTVTAAPATTAITTAATTTVTTAVPVGNGLPVASGSMSPTGRSFHVQKPGAKINGQKRSFDPVNFEKADPNTYRIVQPTENGNGMHIRTGSMDNGDSLRYFNSAPPFNHVQPLPSGPFDQPAVMGYHSSEYAQPLYIDRRASLASVSIKPELPNAVPTKTANGMSYIAGFPAGSNGAGHLEEPPGTGPDVRGVDLPPAPRSCCAGKAQAATNGHGRRDSQTQQFQAQPNPQPLVHAPLPAEIQPHLAHFQAAGAVTGGGANDFRMSQMDANVGMGRPIVQVYHQPQPMSQPAYFHQTGNSGVYSFPATYGTFANPIVPSQWRSTVQSVPAIPSQQNGQELHASPGATFSQDGPGADVMQEFLNHDCECGPSCNCLGCLVHPYTEATAGYLRSAMTCLAESPPAQQPHQHQHQHQQQGEQQHTPALVAATNSSDADGPAPRFSTATTTTTEPPSPAEQTPSEASEDQTQLSASDYLFVTYPFSCLGEPASCPCGDDCACDGCVIHGPRETPNEA